MSYAYQQGYGKLSSMTYANGYSEQYSYNDLGLLTALYKNGSNTPSYTYRYDGNGNLIEEASASGRFLGYTYDSLSRLTGSSLYVLDQTGTEYVLDFSKALTYDDESRLSQIQYTFTNRNLVYSSVYGESDRLESLSLASAWERSFQYDYLQRLTSATLKNATGYAISQTTYGFLSPEAGKTTTMVNRETNSAADETLRYTYDSYGRVTQVLKNNEVINRYSYHPTYGFLVREDNAAANETYLYTYDEMGNMLEKQTYVLSFASNPEWILDWETFSYASSDLGKLYNSSFGYDALGNLTFDMEKCWSYTWDGRQLVDITADGGLPRFTFAYDSNGVRTQKGVAQSWDEWIYHDYTLDGTTILKETIYNEAYGMISDVRDIYYYYDENGSPVGLNWNGEDYYYYKNIFGDVLGIMDSAGSMVVRYTYDAWGNPISTTGAMASTLGRDNPFRYRGYYYDVETGLYYLNARYYNPEWGRFISPDEPQYLGADGTPFSYNLYIYCGNNPVAGYDPSGNWDWGIFGKIVAATAIVAVCLTGVGVIAATAATIVGASATAAATAAVVSAGATVVCGTIDGIACAKASGGDLLNGAIAGAIGSSFGAVVSQFSDFTLGADSALRFNIVGRMASSFVYDITYEYLETGKVDNWGDHAVDVVMDAAYAPISYGYIGNLNNRLFKAGLNGLVDGFIDVFQTSYCNRGNIK